MHANMKKEEILQYVKENMPSGLLEEEKALYIAMCIAECKNFNERYLWSITENPQEIYRKAQKVAGSKDENYQRRKLICVGISDLFYYVAKNMGQEVYLVVKGKKIENLKELKMGQHVYNAIRTSDGRMICVDVEKDLSRLQTHCRLIGFGGIPSGCNILGREFQNNTNEKDENDIDFQQLQEEEIERCVKKTNYLPEGSTYTDEYIGEIIKKNASKETSTILDIILKDEKVNAQISHTGPSEAYRFWEIIMQIIDNNKGLAIYKQIKFYKCELQIKNKKSAYNFFVRVNCGDESKFYMFSKKNHNMIEVLAEELEYYMLNNGLKIIDPEILIKEELKNRKKVNKKECKNEKENIESIMVDSEDSKDREE